MSYLDELTMEEVKEVVRKNKLVILPIGSIEEHGTHLPLCTDSLQAEEIAEQLATKLDAIVMPPLRYGICTTTRNFPGTISVSFDTFRELIYEILSELVRHGFKRIVVFSGHAGRTHMAAIKVAARKIIDSHPELKLMVLSDYDLASHFRGRYGIPEYNGHAGAIETSRLLAMNKELVRSQGVPEEPSLPPFMVVAEPEKYFSTGVMGDPTRATVELGKKIRSYVVEQMVKLIKEQME